MKPKYYIIIAGIICLAAGLTTTVIVRNKLHKAESDIAVLTDRNVRLEEEKKAALARVDTLMAEHEVLKGNAAKQAQFADSMLTELSRFKRKIVFIYDTNDNIVGSLDIDGQQRAFTNFLNLAAQDSIH